MKLGKPLSEGLGCYFHRRSFSWYLDLGGILGGRDTGLGSFKGFAGAHPSLLFGRRQRARQRQRPRMRKEGGLVVVAAAAEEPGGGASTQPGQPFASLLWLPSIRRAPAPPQSSRSFATRPWLPVPPPQ